MPKTAAERSREYRERKKATRIKIKKSPKSSTERVREFRERRKKLINNSNETFYVNNNVSGVPNCTENLKNEGLLTIEHQQFMDLYCNNSEHQPKCEEDKEEKVFLGQEARNDSMDANIINDEHLEKSSIVKTTSQSDDSYATNPPESPKSGTEAFQGNTLKHQGWPTIEVKPIDSYCNNSDDKQQYNVEECNMKQENEDDTCSNLMDANIKIEEDSEELWSRIGNNTLNDQENAARMKFQDIRDNIKKVSFLPPTWLYVDNPNGIAFMRMDLKSRRIVNHLRLNVDRTVTLVTSDEEELQLNEKINSLRNIYDYLKSAEKWPICVGTQIEDNEYSKCCKGVLYGNNASSVRYDAHPRCEPCRNLLNSIERDNLKLANLKTETAAATNLSDVSKNQIKHIDMND